MNGCSDRHVVQRGDDAHSEVFGVGTATADDLIARVAHLQPRATSPDSASARLMARGAMLDVVTAHGFYATLWQCGCLSATARSNVQL